jgi:hypothetical protein
MANELRTALPTYEERRAAGRALRDRVKRGDLGRWRPPKDRLDPIDLIEEAHAGRLERLIPVRVTGPWEWDLWRLATSIWVAGRQNRLPEGTCEDAVLWCAAAYRRQIGRLAGQPLLARSFDRMDIDRMRQEMADWSLRAEIERAANLARLRTSDRALPKLTREREGVRYIVDQPPVVMHISDDPSAALAPGAQLVRGRRRGP